MPKAKVRNSELEELRKRVAELEQELQTKKLHLDLVTDGVWDWDMSSTSSVPTFGLLISVKY